MKKLFALLVVFGTIVTSSNLASAYVPDVPQHQYIDVNETIYRSAQTLMDGVYHNVDRTGYDMKLGYNVGIGHYAYKDTLLGIAKIVLLTGLTLPDGLRIADALTAFCHTSSLTTYTVSFSGIGYSSFSVPLVHNGIYNPSAIPAGLIGVNNLGDTNPNVHLYGYIDSTNTMGLASSTVTIHVRSVDTYSILFLDEGFIDVTAVNDYTITRTCYGI